MIITKNFKIAFKAKSIIIALLLSFLLPLQFLPGSLVANENNDANNDQNSSLFNMGQIRRDDIVLGDVNSKNIVIEYTAPTCHHCGDYHRGVFKRIKQDYIDTGKIAYVARSVVGSRQDMDASILMICASEIGLYQEVSKDLFENQSEWAFNINYREMLAEMGAAFGLSHTRYTHCLNDKEITQIIFKRNKELMSLNGAGATPFFIINGIPASGSYTTLYSEIEQNLN
jgi:protein-disulfide isomerase